MMNVVKYNIHPPMHCILICLETGKVNSEWKNSITLYRFNGQYPRKYTYRLFLPQFRDEFTWNNSFKKFNLINRTDVQCGKLEKIQVCCDDNEDGKKNKNDKVGLKELKSVYSIISLGAFLHTKLQTNPEHKITNLTQFCFPQREIKIYLHQSQEVVSDQLEFRWRIY